MLVLTLSAVVAGTLATATLTPSYTITTPRFSVLSNDILFYVQPISGSSLEYGTTTLTVASRLITGFDSKGVGGAVTPQYRVTATNSASAPQNVRIRVDSAGTGYAGAFADQYVPNWTHTQGDGYSKFGRYELVRSRIRNGIAEGEWTVPKTHRIVSKKLNFSLSNGVWTGSTHVRLPDIIAESTLSHHSSFAGSAMVKSSTTVTSNAAIVEGVRSAFAQVPNHPFDEKLRTLLTAKFYAPDSSTVLDELLVTWDHTGIDLPNDLLAAGTYDIRISGSGIKPMLLEDVTLSLTPTPFSITVRLGDVNDDGLINTTDLASIDAAIGISQSHPLWFITDANGAMPASCDLNQDGVVNITDRNLVVLD